jgi:contact-dependent growth inhibition (CDI) system CdiI-like immunity protein
MNRKTKAIEVALAPEEFPALHEFFAAYLHQDFRDEYGSATKAAKRYVKDASSDQAQSLRSDWLRFRQRFAGQPFATVQAAIRKLGAAWLPESEAALTQLDAALK